MPENTEPGTLKSRVEALKKNCAPVEYQTLKKRFRLRECLLMSLILLADYILVRSFPKTTLVPEKYLHKLSKPLFENQKVVKDLQTDNLVGHRRNGFAIQFPEHRAKFEECW